MRVCVRMRACVCRWFDPLAAVCDCVGSEWMGYALVYESMLNTVLKARDLYLVRPLMGAACCANVGMCEGKETLTLAHLCRI